MFHSHAFGVPAACTEQLRARRQSGVQCVAEQFGSTSERQFESASRPRVCSGSLENAMQLFTPVGDTPMGGGLESVEAEQFGCLEKRCRTSSAFFGVVRSQP